MTTCIYCGAPLFLGRHCPNDPRRLDGTWAPSPFTQGQRKHHGTRLLMAIDGIWKTHLDWRRKYERA